MDNIEKEILSEIEKSLIPAHVFTSKILTWLVSKVKEKDEIISDRTRDIEYYHAKLMVSENAFRNLGEQSVEKCKFYREALEKVKKDLMWGNAADRCEEAHDYISKVLEEIE